MLVNIYNLANMNQVIRRNYIHTHNVVYMYVLMYVLTPNIMSPCICIYLSAMNNTRKSPANDHITLYKLSVNTDYL